MVGNAPALRKIFLSPKDVVARLNREAVKALEAPDVRERYAGMGVEPAGFHLRARSRLSQKRDRQYARVIKAIGLRIE